MGTAGAGRQQAPLDAAAAGMPARKGGKRGIAYVYNVKELRDREIDIARTAESVYERFVSHWQPRRPTAGRTGAAKEDRR